MVCNAWHSWPTRCVGGLLALVLWLQAAPATAQLGMPNQRPNTQPSRSYKVGPDQGYAYQYSSTNLLDISRMILKLAQDLVQLMRSFRESGSSFDAEAVMDGMSRLQAAAQERRRMQMANVFEEAVDEMIDEEEASKKQGKERSPQELVQVVTVINKKVDKKVEAITGAPPPAPTAPPPSSPNNKPPPPRKPVPTEREAVQSELNQALAILDDPTRPHAPSTPTEAIEQLEKLEERLIRRGKGFLSKEAGERLELTYHRVFNPVIEQMKKNDKSGTAWLEMGAKLISTPDTTKAQPAETKAMQDWRQQNENLQVTLKGQDIVVRHFEWSNGRQPSAENRQHYDNALKSYRQTQQELKAHQNARPLPGSGP